MKICRYVGGEGHPGPLARGRGEGMVAAASTGGRTAGARRYHPDVDGLRAVAVVAVILTHLHLPGFSGGFVGVDVFFVISGFLIVRELLRAREDGLSIRGFYARRARRTLPALFFVSAVSLGVATLTLMPGDLDDMARSLLGTVLLAPNILFATQFGYFDQAAAAKPLLHTWSLGVEAQFYLAAPLLTLAIDRRGVAGRRLGLLLLAGASLGGCVLTRAWSPDAAFFLMPTRLFEFLVGGLLADGSIAPIARRWVAEATTGAAAATLALCVAVFSKTTPVPGPASLVPCLAAAAIIHAGSGRTLVGAALGSRALAFIGTISYSLYLWHWPMIVLARDAGLPMTLSGLAAGAVVLLAASILTWRFVEQPFRRPSSPLRRHAGRLLPVGGLLLGGGGGLVLAGNGLPDRFPPSVAAVASTYSTGSRFPYREGRCFITSKEAPGAFDRGACLAIRPDAANVLLLGDSHAAHLQPGFRDVWPSLNLLQATASGCKPLLGATGAARCTTLMRAMLEDFIPAHHLDAIVIAALWDEADIPALRATIAAVRPYAARVVVFGPVPRYDQPASTLIARAMLRDELARVPSHLLPGVKPLDALMEAAVAPLAAYVSPYRVLCPRDRCRLLAAPGVPMQFDYHHLTREGSDWLVATLRRDDPALLGAALAGPALSIDEKAVAGAAHRLQEQRVGRIRLDLPSQPVDLHVDRPLVAGAARTAQGLP